MARPEQVLLLEPQHELKFRGNVKAEAGGDRAGHQVANLCAVIRVRFVDFWSTVVTFVKATAGPWKNRLNLLACYLRSGDDRWTAAVYDDVLTSELRSIPAS